MANPGKHELFNPPIHLSKADRGPNEFLNILLIFRRECCGMFGLKLAEALSHMTDSILAFSDLLNQTVILLLWEHHGDFHISQFDCSELLKDCPDSGQVHGGVPVIQNGHHVPNSI